MQSPSLQTERTQFLSDWYENRLPVQIWHLLLPKLTIKPVLQSLITKALLMLAMMVVMTTTEVVKVVEVFILGNGG